MKRTAVAIVGSHPDTRGLVRWNDPNLDIWVFNEAAGQGWVKRWDATFQLHLPIIWKNPQNRNDPKHYEWLRRKHDGIIWMHDEFPDVPSSRKFPLDEVCAALLPNLKRRKGKHTTAVRYFTSSPAYAIAYAIYLGYERIELYGIEMATETEYLMQRDGVTFWVGIAMGRGIEVVIPEQSGMFRSLMYGYEGDIVIHRQEFESNANVLSKRAAELLVKLQTAAHNVVTIEKKIGAAKDDKEAEKYHAAYVQARKAHLDTVMEYGVCSGALQTNEMYLRKVDEMIRAAGGEKALEAFLPEYAKLNVEAAPVG